MQYNADPDFVMHYCIQETALSPLVRRMTFSNRTRGRSDAPAGAVDRGTGVDYRFPCASAAIRPTGDYHYLKLNFCTAAGVKCRCQRGTFISIRER